jgi:hypothetical protein
MIHLALSEELDRVIATAQASTYLWWIIMRHAFQTGLLFTPISTKGQKFLSHLSQVAHFGVSFSFPSEVHDGAVLKLSIATNRNRNYAAVLPF